MLLSLGIFPSTTLTHQSSKSLAVWIIGKPARSLLPENVPKNLLSQTIDESSSFRGRSSTKSVLFPFFLQHYRPRTPFYSNESLETRNIYIWITFILAKITESRHLVYISCQVQRCTVPTLMPTPWYV